MDTTKHMIVLCVAAVVGTGCAGGPSERHVPTSSVGQIAAAGGTAGGIAAPAEPIGTQTGYSGIDEAWTGWESTRLGGVPVEIRTATARPYTWSEEPNLAAEIRPATVSWHTGDFSIGEASYTGEAKGVSSIETRPGGRLWGATSDPVNDAPFTGTVELKAEFQSDYRGYVSGEYTPSTGDVQAFEFEDVKLSRWGSYWGELDEASNGDGWDSEVRLRVTEGQSGVLGAFHGEQAMEGDDVLVFAGGFAASGAGVRSRPEPLRTVTGYGALPSTWSAWEDTTLGEVEVSWRSSTARPWSYSEDVVLGAEIWPAGTGWHTGGVTVGSASWSGEARGVSSIVTRPDGRYGTAVSDVAGDGAFTGTIQLTANFEERFADWTEGTLSGAYSPTSGGVKAFEFSGLDIGRDGEIRDGHLAEEDGGLHDSEIKAGFGEGMASVLGVFNGEQKLAHGDVLRFAGGFAAHGEGIVPTPSVLATSTGWGNLENAWSQWESTRLGDTEVTRRTAISHSRWWSDVDLSAEIRPIGADWHAGDPLLGRATYTGEAEGVTAVEDQPEKDGTFKGTIDLTAYFDRNWLGWIDGTVSGSYTRTTGAVMNFSFADVSMGYDGDITGALDEESGGRWDSGIEVKFTEGMETVIGAFHGQQTGRDGEVLQFAGAFAAGGNAPTTTPDEPDLDLPDDPGGGRTHGVTAANTWAVSPGLRMPEDAFGRGWIRKRSAGAQYELDVRYHHGYTDEEMRWIEAALRVGYKQWARYHDGTGPLGQSTFPVDIGLSETEYPCQANTLACARVWPFKGAWYPHRVVESVGFDEVESLSDDVGMWVATDLTTHEAGHNVGYGHPTGMNGHDTAHAPNDSGSVMSYAGVRARVTEEDVTNWGREQRSGAMQHAKGPDIERIRFEHAGASGSSMEEWGVWLERTFDLTELETQDGPVLDITDEITAIGFVEGIPATHGPQGDATWSGDFAGVDLHPQHMQLLRADAGIRYTFGIDVMNVTLHEFEAYGGGLIYADRTATWGASRFGDDARRYELARDDDGWTGPQATLHLYSDGAGDATGIAAGTVADTHEQYAGAFATEKD